MLGFLESMGNVDVVSYLPWLNWWVFVLVRCETPQALEQLPACLESQTPVPVKEGEGEQNSEMMYCSSIGVLNLLRVRKTNQRFAL